MTTFAKSQVVSLLPLAYSAVPGWQEPVEVTPPAKGSASWNYTVKGPEYALLYSVAFKLTTSATTGTRYLNLTLTDAAGRIFQKDDLSLGVAASTIIHCYAAIGKQQSIEASGTSTTPIPAYFVPPGWQFGAEVAGVQAGDVFSEIYLLLHKVPSDNARQIMQIG